MLSQSWWDAAVPLFVSRRRLGRRGRLPVPKAPWALDSGGFTELSLYGEWRTTEAEYVADVRRFAEMGYLEWVAPMDWMCEPFMLEKTGMTVQQHQRLTIENYKRLENQLGDLVIPVLQGWTRDDYMRCFELYHRVGVDLEWKNVVGLGTVCRRQDTTEAGQIVRDLSDLFLGRQLHGFGVKITGLRAFGDALLSADSMAWSYAARRDHPLRGCGHKSCANCLRFALRWRNELVNNILGQQRLEVA
jgi:hypothetical protein